MAHPHWASKNVGVVVFKRIRCTGTSPPVCAVFKTAQCIKTSSKVFHSHKESDATKAELEAFAAQAANAYDNPGTHYASIKNANKCGDADAKKAADFVRAF